MQKNINLKGNKSFRLLNIYERLNNGEIINKDKLSKEFEVSQKTIQRDIDDLRSYFYDIHPFEIDTCIKYDREKNGYYLKRSENDWLTKEEILATCKILLDSRAFEKDEMNRLVGKITKYGTYDIRKYIENIISDELDNFIPLKHNKKLLKIIWILTEYIENRNIISFTYTRQDGKSKEHKVKPISIIFSDYYFYLITYMLDDNSNYPVIFRIDRINELENTGDSFRIPYSDRFSDSEFKKRVQFMYSGELQKVKFKFSGPSLEAILDKLPTAKILEEREEAYILEAESFGNGIYMWLRTQGKYVEIIE